MTGALNDVRKEFYEKSISGEIGVGLSTSAYWWNYDNSLGPISIAAADTYYNLTNDTLGPNTFTDYAISGYDIWDSSAQAFDFTSLEVGSVLTMRLDVEVTTDSANEEVDIVLTIADGEASSFDLPVLSGQVYKSAGTYRIVENINMFIGSALTKDYPARFKIRTDDAGSSVSVNGWYIKLG